METVKYEPSKLSKNLRFSAALQPVSNVLRYLLVAVIAIGVLGTDTSLADHLPGFLFRPLNIAQFTTLFFVNEASIWAYKYKVLSTLTGKKI